MAETLFIVVVEEDPERAAIICDALAGAGVDLRVIEPGPGLARRIAALQPELVLIDAANPSRDQLEELTLASGPLERPVAIFVDQSDSGMTRAVVESGVAAYVVDGLKPTRIRTVLDAAMARFNMLHKMRAELAQTRAALEERKLVDRAKGILMRARGLGEDEAYSLMRKTAMEKGRKMADIAQAIVTASEMLK